MKLKKTILKPQNKRINLSAMLSSDLFFHRSIQIQLALNQDRIIPRNYLIKKAKSKINTGKKNKIKNNNKNTLDESFEAYREKDNKEIPDELDKILVDNQKKFAKENKRYRELKKYNDVISSFWHYINKTNKKKERENLFKKYFSRDDKNIINLYSDQLQKLTTNLFKTNPLLLKKKNADMFFHYLSEFNKYYNDEDKYIYVKQKIITFLERLRDYLEFVKINVDSGMDSISKDIKIKNSKYLKEYDAKLKREIKSLNKKRKILNYKDIKETEKVINKTKETINELFNNKNIFEDPVYFDPTYSIKNCLKSRNDDYIYKYSYKNKYNLSSPNVVKNNNNYSPNKTFKMSTISTGFYAPEKSTDINNNKNNDLFTNDSISKPKHFKFKKIIITQNRKKLKSSVFNLKLRNNYFNTLNEPKKIKKIVIKAHNSIEMEKNSERESLSSFIDNYNEKYQKKKIQNNLNNNNNNNIKSNYKSKRKSEEDNIFKLLSSKTPIIYNYQKKCLHSSLSINKDKDTSKDSINGFRKKSIVIKANDKRSSKIYKNIFDINKKSSDRSDKNSVNGNVNKYQNLNDNLDKDSLSWLYESIKEKHKIKEADINNIKIYLKQNGKLFNNNMKSMDIIRRAKKITDRLDVEKKTKKVFQPFLSHEQIKKLDNIKNVNKILNKLDVDFMNHIFDYKSKSSDIIQLYNQD